jgi:acyl-CoA thioester hydrolase
VTAPRPYGAGMPTLAQQPTYAEVLAVPPVIETHVDPAYIDVNGHMNVRHYLTYGATGADVVCRDVGLDDAYRAERRMGVFTAEHHIRYFSEMHEGDPFSVHTMFLERGARSGHMMSFILDRRLELLSCTIEILLVHVDMDTRRAVPFPDDIAAGFDRWVAAAAEVAWPVPVSGVMGIRR